MAVFNRRATQLDQGSSLTRARPSASASLHGDLILHHFKDSLRDRQLPHPHAAKIYRRMMALALQDRPPSVFGMANVLPTLQFHYWPRILVTPTAIEAAVGIPAAALGSAKSGALGLRLIHG